MMGSFKQRGLAQASDQKALFGFERDRSPARIKLQGHRLQWRLMSYMLHRVASHFSLHHAFLEGFRHVLGNHVDSPFQDRQNHEAQNQAFCKRQSLAVYGHFWNTLEPKTNHELLWTYYIQMYSNTKGMLLTAALPGYLIHIQKSKSKWHAGTGCPSSPPAHLVGVKCGAPWTNETR